MASLKGAVEGEDVEAIKAKPNDLAQASMTLGEALYKAGNAEPGGAEGHAEPKDDVIDADFKEVGPDEKKSA